MDMGDLIIENPSYFKEAPGLGICDGWEGNVKEKHPYEYQIIIVLTRPNEGNVS